jgi:hypothetical protein
MQSEFAILTRHAKNGMFSAHLRQPQTAAHCIANSEKRFSRPTGSFAASPHNDKMTYQEIAQAQYQRGLNRALPPLLHVPPSFARFASDKRNDGGKCKNDQASVAPFHCLSCF